MASLNDMQGDNTTQKTCTLMGANWCGFTKKQEAALEGGMKQDLKGKGINVEVMDCADETTACPKLEGYPTWKNEAGDMMPGYTADVDKIASFCGGSS